MHKFKNNSGFTIIELLVVIAIIAILSTVVTMAVSSARVKGRDSGRVSDLKQVQNALELYQVDNKSYPSTSGAWWGVCSGFGSHDVTGPTGYIPDLAPLYIPKLPVDPKPIEPDGCYVYNSDGTDYMLLAYKTVEGTVPSTLVRPSAPTEQDYAFYTPGASMW